MYVPVHLPGPTEGCILSLLPQVGVILLILQLVLSVNCHLTSAESLLPSSQPSLSPSKPSPDQNVATTATSGHRKH